MIDFSFFLGPIVFRVLAFGSGRISTEEKYKELVDAIVLELDVC